MPANVQENYGTLLCQPSDPPQQSRPTRSMLMLTFFSALGGFLFGYDTGVVSGAMLLVRKDFNLSTLWHEAIVAATIGAAWLLAVPAGALADRVGRRPVILTASALFAVGSAVMAAAAGKALLLSGRIIVGAAIGLASMCVPLYLSEVSEASVRGRITVTNVLFITAGQLVASILCGVLSGVSGGWRWMLGLAAVPAVTQFVGFVFMPESPRWLVANGRVEEARVVLQRFRAQEDDVDLEVAQIVEAAERDKITSGSGSFGRILSSAAVRRSLVLGCLLQLFQQLAGINTVMYYSASIITMAGIRDPAQAIWISAGVSLGNFLFTLVGLWLVELIGRRPLLLSSLAGVVVSLFTLAASFQMSFLSSPAVGLPVSSPLCGNYTSCTSCTSSPHCGYCYTGSLDLSSCLPSNADQYNKVSTVGNCTAPGPPAVFAYDWCPSKFGWLSILGLVFYVACFAPGMGPLPWTINSELYPGWARARCVGISTSVNWMSNLIVSLSFLSLIQSLNVHGAFYLYACLSAAGLAIIYCSLPETKGLPLENVQQLFEGPFFSAKRMIRR